MRYFQRMMSSRATDVIADESIAAATAAATSSEPVGIATDVEDAGRRRRERLHDARAEGGGRAQHGAAVHVADGAARPARSRRRSGGRTPESRSAPIRRGRGRQRPCPATSSPAGRRRRRSIPASAGRSATGRSRTLDPGRILDRQAAFADRVAVGAAGDERDVVAVLGQPPPTTPPIPPAPNTTNLIAPIVRCPANPVRARRDFHRPDSASTLNLACGNR